MEFAAGAGAGAGLALGGLDLGFIAYRAAFNSFPNLITIFVGIALFCSLYPTKGRASLRLGTCLLACVALSVLSTCNVLFVRPVAVALLGSWAGGLTTTLFFLAVLCVCLGLSRWAFELGKWDAIFCCTAGYITQNFAHMVWVTLGTIAPDLGALDAPGEAACELVVYTAVFSLAYATVVNNIHANRLEGEGDAKTILVLAGVMVVNITFSTLINELSSTQVLHQVELLALCMTHLLVSALTLVLDYQILFSNRMQADAVATRQMMEDQRRQYELSASTIEAINVRCHDIKHQIRSLGAGAGGQATTSEFMENLDELVSIYDTGIDTSNRALDVILTEKTLLAQAKGIQLTCPVDGRLLSFMAEQDVYSLFGNALDNAIEACEKVADPARRLIDVSTRKAGQMACIQVRNCYDGEVLAEKDGTFASTKRDAGLHGYGTKSLRLIAERYDGTCTFDAADGIFRVSILLPLP